MSHAAATSASIIQVSCVGSRRERESTRTDIHPSEKIATPLVASPEPMAGSQREPADGVSHTPTYKAAAPMIAVPHPSANGPGSSARGYLRPSSPPRSKDHARLIQRIIAPMRRTRRPSDIAVGCRENCLVDRLEWNIPVGHQFDLCDTLICEHFQRRH